MTNARCKIIDCKQSYWIKDCSDNMDTKNACIELTCDEGYILSDYKARFKSTCVDDLWEPELPVCQECGIDPRITLSIAGGYELDRPVPWHAGLYRETTETAYYFCGGTIVHSKAVITAAHCVRKFDNYQLPTERFPQNEMRVAVGKKFINYYANETNEQKLKILDIKITEYSSTFGNDIAILILREKIKLNPDVTPICINYVSENNDWPLPTPKVHGTAVGWGLTENGKNSDILKEAEFDVCCDYTLCRKKVVQFARSWVSPDKFCIEETNGVAVDEGDSGGGFVIRNNGRHYLYGIVSVKTERMRLFTLFGYHTAWAFENLDVY